MMYMLSVLTRPWHCSIIALFQGMLHYKYKGSQGHKEGKTLITKHT